MSEREYSELEISSLKKDLRDAMRKMAKDFEFNVKGFPLGGGENDDNVEIDEDGCNFC